MGMIFFKCSQSLSHVQLFATPWTVAHQAPLSMEFSRQEYWSGLSCQPLGVLPDPETKLASLTSPALVGGFFNTRATWEATQKLIKLIYKGSLQGLYSERDLSNIYIGLLFIRGFPCGSAGKKSTQRDVVKWENQDWNIIQFGTQCCVGVRRESDSSQKAI